MLTSFFSGLSGLNSNSTYISAIGNNLANVNTVGFKADTVDFSDVLHSTLGTNGAGNPVQIGMGSKVADISPSFVQGGLQSTGGETDVAIEGRGFLIVEGPNGRFYTRAGSLIVDSDGQLLTPDGANVQGYTTRDALGQIVAAGALADVTVPNRSGLRPRGDDELQRPDESERPGEHRRHLHVVADRIRFSRSGPRHERRLHEHRTGRVELLGRGRRRGHHGRHRGHPRRLGAGTLAFDGTGNLDPATGVDGALPRTSPSPWAPASGRMEPIRTRSIGISSTRTGRSTSPVSRPPSATSSTIQDGIGAAPIVPLVVASDGLLSRVSSRTGRSSRSPSSQWRGSITPMGSAVPGTTCSARPWAPDSPASGRRKPAAVARSSAERSSSRTSISPRSS